MFFKTVSICFKLLKRKTDKRLLPKMMGLYEISYSHCQLKSNNPETSDVLLDFKASLEKNEYCALALSCHYSPNLPWLHNLSICKNGEDFSRA